MPFQKDFYDIFDISCCATQQDIFNAYLELAEKYRSEKSTEKLEELNQVYAILCNPEKRKIYDEENDHAGHKDETHLVEAGNTTEVEWPSKRQLIGIFFGISFFGWLIFRPAAPTLVGEGFVRSVANDVIGVTIPSIPGEQRSSFSCKVTSGNFAVGDFLEILRNQARVVFLQITDIQKEAGLSTSSADVGDAVTISLEGKVSIADGDALRCYRRIERTSSSGYSSRSHSSWWPRSTGRSSSWGGSSWSYSSSTSSRSSCRSCCSKCSSRGR
jgi:curved DNA-binding protein CbpA